MFAIADEGRLTGEAEAEVEGILVGVEFVSEGETIDCSGCVPIVDGYVGDWFVGKKTVWLGIYEVFGMLGVIKEVLDVMFCIEVYEVIGVDVVTVGSEATGPVA